MKTNNAPVTLQEATEQTSFAHTIKEWEDACKNCRPLTPLTCVTHCRIWKLKNEFRNLNEKMRSPDFKAKLLNTLKNKRRLRILEKVSKGRYSITRLQQELRRLGYHHSKQTITKEYITPLIDVALVQEDQGQYYTTLFGCRLNELIKNFHDTRNILPTHSECYEEAALIMLLDKPKNHEELEGAIPSKSVSRVLNRLQRAGSIQTTKENDYIFHFKTKRDSSNTKFSPTERRVYENIPMEGISACKLAEETKISLRRTYKYLRRLKGKKLVFARKIPKSYSLTAEGLRTALMLKEIRKLVMEASATASQFSGNEGLQELSMPDAYQTKSERKNKKGVPLAPYNLLSEVE